MQTPDNAQSTPDDTPFIRRFINNLSRLDKLGITAVSLVLIVGVAILLIYGNKADQYSFLKSVHYWISRGGFGIALVMLATAVYIGLYKHGDVTPWFRSITYTIVGFMVLQGLIGGLMWLMDGRPGEEVHLIYGYGVVLSLPFFIFVEVTAQKRPAMGSYIWGFTLLAAIIVRTISTGPMG